MVHIPDKVRARPADFRGKGWKGWYVPANTERDLPRGVRTGAMNDFLMSDRIGDLVGDVSKDIIDDAKQNAAEGGKVASGQYVNSFGLDEVVVLVADPYPNPRRGVRVANSAPHASAVEFGNSKTEGKRPLGRAGAKYDSPKGGGDA